VRVLIVGYGRMGHFHARTVLAAGDTPITLDTQAPANHKSWRTVGHIDAAIIACPIEHLYDHARRALDRGIPVLVEKPGAETLEQARNLTDQHPDLAVGYVERLNPVVIALAEHATTSHVTFTRHGPGMAPLGLDVAAHDIDLHRLYFPDCTATIDAQRSLTRVRTITTGGYTADLLTRRLRHPDGCIVRYHQRDLLAEQYARFVSGRPAATIADATAVHQILAEHAYTTPPLAEAA
jgi:hypothetical protein